MFVAQAEKVVEMMVKVLNEARLNGHRSCLALRMREHDLAFASYTGSRGSNDSVVCCNSHRLLIVYMSEAASLE